MSNDQSKSQTEQRYEYGVARATENINDYAEDGWRLIETVEKHGTTKKLIFERPIDD